MQREPVAPRLPAPVSPQVRKGRYYFGDLDPSPRTPFCVAYAGVEDCAPNYDIDRSGFSYHALEFVQNGRWLFTQDGQSTTLGPGAVFTYGPGVGYQLAAQGGKPLRKYFVDFAGRRAKAVLAQHGLGGGPPRVLAQTSKLREIFEQLIDCASLPESAARGLSEQLGRLILTRVQVDRELAGPVQDRAHRRFVQARQVMLQDYAAMTSVDAVAQACGLSAPYLCRLFRRFADESPLQFLTRVRMQHAAEFLIRHDASVQSAAYALGYTDPFHFSRVFKRVHGLSPTAFVRRHEDSAGRGAAGRGR